MFKASWRGPVSPVSREEFEALQEELAALKTAYLTEKVRRGEITERLGELEEQNTTLQERLAENEITVLGLVQDLNQLRGEFNGGQIRINGLESRISANAGHAGADVQRLKSELQQAINEARENAQVYPEAGTVRAGLTELEGKFGALLKQVDSDLRLNANSLQAAWKELHDTNSATQAVHVRVDDIAERVERLEGSAETLLESAEKSTDSRQRANDRIESLRNDFHEARREFVSRVGILESTVNDSKKFIAVLREIKDEHIDRLVALEGLTERLGIITDTVVDRLDKIEAGSPLKEPHAVTESASFVNPKMTIGDFLELAAVTGRSASVNLGAVQVAGSVEPHDAKQTD